MKKIEIDINKKLHDFFGFKKFKGNQEKAINSILEGNNKEPHYIISENTITITDSGGEPMAEDLDNPNLKLTGITIGDTVTFTTHTYYDDHEDYGPDISIAFRGINANDITKN